ncbi:methylglyoxal reductase [Lachnotalea glycerini]|uniref:Aldo/keto reductase n=1 Tax=Lachnotalea glycerini TaxID=1763509 RepID=A0A255I6R2_9FIRM|nr:aldo/keto reductase [Lachnotalea glycerini]PXV95673.1 methylglyoxal reductase [Lachnotalea glycerini]RDY33279.1 aldo/keto reductase [Lachnotalea glycerini]
MKKIRLGNGDTQISQIGLGTWAIGGGPAWGGDKDTRECINTIQEAPKLGINLIDTAPGYNFGNSEKIVGEALKGIKREEIVIITKCGIVWKRKGSLFNKVGDTQLYKNLSKESIREEIEESLERLGIDYIDVYMTHWQSVEPFLTPISETMEVLNDMKKEGLIKAIGAANATPDHIKEYIKYGQLDIVQGKYSVLDREIEKDLIPICKENHIILQAYSPLEQGLLTGTFPRDYVPVGAQCNKKWFRPDKMQKAMDMMEKWKPLCKKYNSSVPTLALAWIIAQGDFISVLNGASTVAQLRENAKAMELEIGQDDLALMRKLAEEADQ